MLSFPLQRRSIAPYQIGCILRQHAMAVGLVLLLLGSACSSGDEIAVPKGATPSRYHIIAYVHGGTPEALGHIGAEMLTHINYAFANVTPEGEVVLERAEDPARLAALTVLRSKNPNLKILLSIGGWGWSDHFSDAALTEASRERFARCAVHLVTAHNLDGLDIDWEYPGQPGEDNIYREEDKENFTLLLKTLRRHLDEQESRARRTDEEGYLLTIAAGAGPTYLAHTDMRAVQEVLNFINLMTYDFHGAWTPRTGHHTNLYPSDATPDASSAATAVAAYLREGVPPHKIVLGAAFYGRGWDGVARENNGLAQPYSGAARSYAFSMLEDRYIDKHGYRRYWDAGAKAPYLWQPDSLHFITYEDEASLRHKAAFVTAQGLGGVMYWQHGHDPAERLLGAIYQFLR